MRKLTLIVLLILVAARARAQEQAEDKDLAELLSILQEETEVATKTRMNSDYVPGIVTVLHGDELEALGIATAWEALGLVPGIQAFRDARANGSTIVRGIDFPFNSGNILVLVNGISLNREDSGNMATALLIPVEQIDRIEVIRGPGSVVYGNFAFMGMVNVITRDEGSRVFGRFESDVSLNMGGRLAWKSKSGPWKGSVSLSRYSSDDAPSQIPEADDDRLFGLFGVSRGGFSLSAQVATRQFDGRERGTPVSTYEDESWAIDGRYRRDFGPGLHTTSRLTYLSNDVFTSVTSFRGGLWKGGVDAVWDGFRRQSWLASAEVSRSTIDEAYFAPQPRPGQPPVLRLLAEDKTRTITGLTLQDTIDVRDRISLTLGARYDSYSDLSDRVTPRVALVWRASEKHIVKAQYAEGYRPPTFFELYSPPIAGARYPFEVNATSEINYVYRGSGAVGRATVFHSVLTDMIRPGGFVTPGRTRADGVELEWTQQLTPAIKLDANVTHLDTEDARTGFVRNIVSSEWLGNLSLLVRPIARTFVGARVNHIGDRSGGDGFDTVDLTVSHLRLDGLDVRGGVKNALDDEVVYLTLLPNNTVLNSPFPGRTWWVQVSFRR